MHLVVYTSEFTGEACDFEEVVESIESIAQDNNRRRGVTGVFFVHRMRFLQFLEGEQEVLQALMKKISVDTRHLNVTYLFDETVPDRGFRHWTMERFNIGKSAQLDLEYLEMVRDACRANFQAHTKTIVSIFKGFIESEDQFA